MKTLKEVKARLDKAQDYILEAVDMVAIEGDDELSELLDEINELINQVLDY